MPVQTARQSDVQSPAASPSIKSYRVRGIQSCCSAATLREGLGSALHVEPAGIRVHSLAADQNDDRTATVSFPETSSCLKQRNKGPTPVKLRHETGPEYTVYIDDQFLGFTPLSPVQDERECTAE